ncbi:hypothetical protein ACFJGW_00595 [Burkholderiaceae bacterium UC74_6]
MRLGLEITTAAAVTRAFHVAPEILLDELETAMGNSLMYLQRETVERTPMAFGTLRGAYVTEQYSSPALSAVFGELSNGLPYAVPVELGTRPHFPPIQPLIDWVEAKLGLAGEQAEAAARGIQRKIGAKGTPAAHMMTNALRDGRSTIEMEFREALQRFDVRVAAAGGQGAAQ